MGYARSFLRIRNFLRIAVGLLDDDIQLILKQQYNIKFVTYELASRIYTNKEISEAVYTMGDHEGTLKIEYDDTSMKKKLFLTRFVSTFGTLRFDGESFFNTLRGFTPYWVYKSTNAIHGDSSVVYTSDKILKLNTIDKIHIKCNVIDGSVLKRVRQPVLFISILNESAGYKILYGPETIHYKK